MYTLDVDDPARLRKRVSWTDQHVGIGSAAHGTVIVARGTAYHSVQVGDDKARDLVPVQAGLRGSYLAGWTTDGRVVFAAGEPGKLRVARARPGRDLEYWPGTQEGVELPHTVVGDSVIVHRIDPAAPKERRSVIERIGPAGERVELARLHDDVSVTPIRCAGDRAGPCVISELKGNQVIFHELDPQRGTLGEVIVQRPIGERYMCDLAVSTDGKQLAIVEGRNELTLYDRETGASKSWPATADAALQSVGFSPAGDLWASSIGFEGRMFGLMVFLKDDRGGVKKFPRSRMRGSDGLRWYWRPSPSPDGKQVAVTVREFRLHLAQIIGL
jgi:WD40 repeat protein